MKVAILWHMHQPTYWDAGLGTYRYPWAFLHAARHYHMMGALAREHPETRMTINVTPVLLEQLVDYSGDDFKDRLLDVIRRPAADLNEEDRALLLDHVFKLNPRTMVDPYPRYRELRHLVEGAGRRRVRRQELTDLQTLYLLTWCGYPLRQNPEIEKLLEKGKNYAEEDKAFIFEMCHGAVREVVPLYRELHEAGHVELSTTPYYHPILPLLIDCDAARESRPDVYMSEVTYRYPQDARWHVEEGKRYFESLIGSAPNGMWPAEGSVSDAALELLESCGLRWAATDERVLGRSLGRFPVPAEDKYRPWRFRDRDMVIYFRDLELSDRIGFVYSGWDPVHAAEDILGRLQAIRSYLGSRRSAEACVSIILDGENCWEYYPDSGVGFLSRFYAGLASTPGLESITMGDASVLSETSSSLSHIVPGSWIEANFDTWIGAPEKNRAWTLLSTARRKLAMEAPQAEVPREFYRAEGSDWFWWLGPGHDTPYEQSYENLFRTNLIEGLKEVGLEPPQALTIATVSLPSLHYQPPTHLFTPRISGRLGNYYDWIAAGTYTASRGSVHRTDLAVELVRFGFDLEHFYLRAEGGIAKLAESDEEFLIALEIQTPKAQRIILRNGTLQRELVAEGTVEPSSGRGAMETVYDVAVPLEELGAGVDDLVEFCVVVESGGDVIERLPNTGSIALRVPSEAIRLENWSV